MKTIHRIWMTHKEEVILSLCASVGFAVLGNLMHDLIVRYVPDEQMTVFPFGTLLTIVSFLMLNLLISLFYSVKFNAVITMGDTRHRFFKDLFVVRLFMSAVFLLVAELSYLYEQWKFATKFPEYEVEVEFNFLHSPYFVVVFLLVSTCFSVLLTALVLRYETKAMIVVWVSFMLFSFGCAKFLDPVLDWTSENLGTISTTGIAGALTAFSLLMMLLSRCMILKQPVK